MLLIACTLALLVIIVGMKFLAQVQKENLGNLYKYVTWFVIIMGFLCLLCIGARCALRHCSKYNSCTMQQNCPMMDHDGCSGMGNMGGCGNMMGCCNHCMMNRGCNEDMRGGCGNMSDKCQHESQCPEHMGCNKGGNEDEGTCPMMKGGMQHDKDSAMGGKKM